MNLAELDCTNYTHPTCARKPGIDPQSTLNPANDLINCDAAGHAVCVTHCPSTGTTACVGFPSGFDDQCDPCATLPDGNYCGKDVGWSALDANTALGCAGGKITADGDSCIGKTCDRTACVGAPDVSACCK